MAGAGLGFDQLASSGVQNAQNQVARRKQLEDEQRQSKQSELDKQAASGAITPVQWGSATSDLYAHEPAESRLGRLKRGAERIVGMKKQADAQKAQADANLNTQRDQTYGVPSQAPTQGSLEPTSPQGQSPASMVTQSFQGKDVPGLVAPGNLDITKRPNINNGDGTNSSTFSMSFGTDKGEVLVPGVGDGVTYPPRKLSPAEALDQYKKTGKNFGTFKDVGTANAYAEALHNDQAKYGNNGQSKGPAPRAQTQHYQNGQQAFQGIMAQAKTPDQLAAEKQKQAISTFTQEGDIQNTQKSAAETKAREDTLALIDKYITDPEANKAAKQEYTQKQAGIFGAPKPLTGAAGQPIEFPPGSGLYARAVTNPDNTTAMIPMPEGWKPPAPKPGSPSVQYTNLLAKKILAGNKQGPPLYPQESAQLEAAKSALTVAGIARADAWAQAAARNHLQAVTNDAGEDVLVPVSQGVAAANAGQPMTAGVVGAPTGADKKNQMLAQSAIAQVDRMQNILRQDPNLTGPGAGQLTTLQTWLGTQDPDAQAFIVSSLLGSEHGVAVFGGRNIHTISDLQSAIGSMKTNPKALAAALQVIKETMQPWTTANGRLPAPRATQGGGGKHKVGDTIMQGGHKFKATAVDQNGKVTAADPVQ
jgi:hypothetical protein